MYAVMIMNELVFCTVEMPTLIKGTVDLDVGENSYVRFSEWVSG